MHWRAETKLEIVAVDFVNAEHVIVRRREQMARQVDAFRTGRRVEREGGIEWQVDPVAPSPLSFFWSVRAPTAAPDRPYCTSSRPAPPRTIRDSNTAAAVARRARRRLANTATANSAGGLVRAVPAAKVVAARTVVSTRAAGAAAGVAVGNSAAATSAAAPTLRFDP